MREDNFEIKTIKLNNHNVKVRIPKRTITLEEALERERQILSKYAKKYSSAHRRK